jgi:excisionase family DNA binding protein
MTTMTLTGDSALISRPTAKRRQAPAPVSAQSGSLCLSDGTQVEIGTDLLRAINTVLTGDLTHARAIVEVVPELISAQTAAQMLGVSRPTVYKMMDCNVLLPARVGAKRLVRVDDVIAVKRARAARSASDEAVAAATPSDIPLDQAALRRALSEARQTGDPEAVKKVRQRQRGALARQAATRARSEAAHA